MKKHTIVGLLLAATLLVLGACATNNLGEYRLEGESLYLSVRVAPEAQVRAHYSVTVDPEDPVSTIFSIGSSVAKASQVHAAGERMDRALDDLRLDLILEDEMADYFGDVMDMSISSRRNRATYVLNLRVHEYGIEAGHGSNVHFILRGRAELYDNASGDLIWEDGFSRTEAFGPAVFGIPGAASNVFSAAMLSELSQEEISHGLERVTRDAAWEIAREFDRDLYWARRSR